MGITHNRTLWLDYLRTTLTVLVVAHHASLAYTTFAAFRPEAYILSTAPVVDTHRWIGLDIFENFNDVFFMSLMFFISGIFVLPSLQKKGVWLFIRDRFYRLLIPFAIAVSLLMLIAYYPAYLQAYHRHDLRHYIIDFFTTEQWPVGPPWFIWLLFTFNLVMALLYPLVMVPLHKFGGWVARLQNRPIGLWLLWFALTWILLVPLALWLGPYRWTGWGPFDFQLSRILLYFGYFTLGVASNSAQEASGLLANNTSVNRRWPYMVGLCLLSYAILTIIPPQLEHWVKQEVMASTTGWMIYYVLYVASCTASCLAFLFAYKALVRTPRPFLQSLSANAYGIYLVHYVFITWTQYLLLPLDLPAIIKCLVSFVLSLALSWGLVALMRKIQWIQRYL
ncbi:acyltransferase family protein [Paraflavitalea pollutisoli]|uniref:acyltransferase family protein n=1 Tax=Paraflavitalea pollutisoli TaxID=3034143 RepID=UPI0023EC0198|nr:acyltransferase [Paraflavitalea sp. H1-2-19X]